MLFFIVISSMKFLYLIAAESVIENLQTQLLQNVNLACVKLFVDWAVRDHATVYTLN